MRPYRLVRRLILQQTLLCRRLTGGKCCGAVGAVGVAAFSALRRIAPFAAFATVAVTAAAFAWFTRLALLACLALFSLSPVVGCGVGVQAGGRLGRRAIVEVLTITSRITLAVIAATALTTFAAWRILPSVWCRAAHCCSHRGFVGHRDVLLGSV